MREFVATLCLLALFAALIFAPDHHPMPRLIAHGCDGAGGDLWAMEESDFPTNCQHIEEY